jgi:hypothetical protein
VRTAKRVTIRHASRRSSQPPLPIARGRGGCADQAPRKISRTSRRRGHSGPRREKSSVRPLWRADHGRRHRPSASVLHDVHAPGRQGRGGARMARGERRQGQRAERGATGGAVRVDVRRLWRVVRGGPPVRGALPCLHAGEAAGDRSRAETADVVRRHTLPSLAKTSGVAGSATNGQRFFAGPPRFSSRRGWGSERRDSSPEIFRGPGVGALDGGATGQ